MEEVQETLRDVAFLYKTPIPLGGVGAEKVYSRALVVARIMSNKMYNYNYNYIYIIYNTYDSSGRNVT